MKEPPAPLSIIQESRLDDAIATAADLPLRELAINHLRYQTLRSLNLMRFAELERKRLEGEDYDLMLDKLIANSLP